MDANQAAEIRPSAYSGSHGANKASVFDCIIIGGGPAGLTAATYLSRFHRRIQLFDDDRSRARWIAVTHNCPGFPHGISGIDLLSALRQQALMYEVPIVPARIVRLTKVQEGWEVEDGRQVLQARSVLLATGVQDRLPPLAHGSIEKAIRTGWIRLCAICDGYEATDRSIGVLGPRASAFRHACFLRTFSSRISVIPITDTDALELSPNDEWVNRARVLGIEILPDFKELSCDDTSCRLLDTSGETHRFDALYVNMGALGRTELAKMVSAATGPGGDILTDANMLTSQPSLYAIGDAVSDLNQIAVAFGHAAIAATAIHNSLPPMPR